MKRYKASAASVEAVSVVGAGDVLAQFIAARVAGKLTEEALRLAVAAAARRRSRSERVASTPARSGRVVAGVELVELASVG